MMAGRKQTDTLSLWDRALQVGMALLGAMLLLGSLGVVMKGALRPQRPAIVEVFELKRTVLGGRTMVQVEAVNRGDVTASAVMIEGIDRTDRVASVTLDYVPGLSRKTATLAFEGDIGQAPLALQATGWVDP